MARGCPVGWVASSRAAWCDSSVAAIVVLLVGEEAVLDGLDNMPLEPTPGGPLPRPARVPALDDIVARAARLSGNVSQTRVVMNRYTWNDQKDLPSRSYTCGVLQSAARFGKGLARHP